LNTLYRLLIALIFFVKCLPGNSQTNISGNLNSYCRVNTVYSLTDSVIVDNTSDFSNGDTVMIIQMKGADFDLSRSNNIVSINNAGKYEIVIIQQIKDNRIKFLSNLLNYYDSSESVQLVRIPSYSHAMVTGNLTCTAWDGYKGGVLALIATDTLELNATIDVSSKGFSGGNETSSGTVCYEKKDSLHYQVSATDRAGVKGGGIGKNSYCTRGRGAIGNAGGGGNGFGSGGGGGAGYGGGGKGGRESCLYCSCDDTLGGFGGRIPADYFAGTTLDKRDRIFLGGGGGSSLGENNDATNGGAGGGLIFILTYHLKTNNHYILTKGEDISASSVAVSQAGAGGGGGGGSVLLAFDKLSGQLRVLASGGKGGNTDHCSGQGGGGGGGFVWYSGTSIQTFDSINVNGGDCGVSIVGCPPNSLATKGSNGGSANRLNPLLNGFLFNVIGKTRTICYGDVPQSILGTTPRGGNGSYTYQWQKRENIISSWQAISDSARKDYFPGALYTTTYFRRIVKSNKLVAPFSLIVDTSKAITINVIPEIVGISVAPDTAICIGLNPVTVRGELASGGDGGAKTYLWQESSDNSTWSNIPSATSKNFAYTSNLVTTYYRRETFNNICVKTSNAVKITIYPVIGRNNIGQPQTICDGSIPKQLLGDTVNGGNNIYRYQWLENNGDSLLWTPVGVADTFDNYSPGVLTNTIFYRRVVYSGLRNTCKDTSNMLKIIVLPKIIQNQIQANQTICGGTSPAIFTGSSPDGGDKAYRYQWLSGKNALQWDSVTTGMGLKDYKHGILDSTIFFKRVVRSGLLDCCKDTSASIKITVQPEIKNNTITSSQEICYAQTPEKLIQLTGVLSGGAGPFAYSWEQRTFDITSWFAISELGNNIDYQPPSLHKTTYFKRKAMSGVCVSYSDSLTVKVLPLLSGNNLSGNSEVCDGLIPAIITGGNITGGQPNVYRYVWQDSVINRAWYDIPAASGKDYIPYVLSEKTYFRRIVKSGYNDCCVNISASFEISINPIPIAAFYGNDTALCHGSNINATLNITSGTPPFEAKFTEGTYQAIVTGLYQGLNNINFVPQQTGNYSIYSVSDNKGCLAVSKNGNVNVRLVEVPNACAGKNAVVEGKTFKLAAVRSVGIGKWYPNLPSTFEPSDTSSKATVIVDNYGTHYFTWRETNEFCWDTATITVIFWKRYTGFSPNNDEVNDFFVIEGLDEFKKDLIVVNRWGNEVYSSDDYKNNWDGTNKSGKPLPSDTYYYVLKVNNSVYKGFVVIKR
jgi:gliding motility-associated-like protein